jgi:opacity protein-like surface antigen
MSRMGLMSHLLGGAGLLALTAGLASTAHAAPPPAPPPPAPILSWSGFYIGAHGGYGWGRDPATDQVFAGKVLNGPNSQGSLGGFQAGANWQSGSWVGGLEVDLSATSIKGQSANSIVETSLVPVPFTETLGISQADKFDWLGSARVRLGFLPVPNLLIYGTAGPAWTRFVQALSFSANENAGALGSETTLETDTQATWRFGAVLGVGAEARLWDSNWLARVEYLHYDFGKSRTFIDTVDSEFQLSGRLTTDVVRAGLSYQLGQTPGMGSYASAAGMPIKAPAVAPWSWSGFFIGAHAGYGWARDPFTDPGEGVDSNITINNINSQGAVGGLQAGYNRQMGSVVGGVELDLSWSGIQGSTTVSVPLGLGATGTDTVSESDNFELLASARARIGYLVMPDVLVYGTGGLAFTRLTEGFTDTTTFTSGGTSGVGANTTTNFRFGWVAGIGAETRLWNTNWLARLEYLHYDFGDSENDVDPSGPPPFTSGHITTDVVRAGLSYKFDWNNPAGAPVKVAMPVKAMPVKAPMLAWSWSGIYLGGHLGYGWGRDPKGETETVTGTLTLPADPLFLTDVNSRGGVAGFQAGANWQLGAFVTGLEVDLSGTIIKGSTTNVSTLGDLAETNTDKFDLLGSARARLGYLVVPNVLLYGTGGLAWTQLHQTQLDPNSLFSSTIPSWEFGWVAGVGGETRLGDTNWLLRLEYLHYDFGNSAGLFATESENLPTAAPPINGTATDIASTGHLTTDVVRAALSYKLN